MTIVLYDLVGADDRRFSANCWRARLALAHKGLDCEVRPTRFTAIPEIADGRQKTVPVIEDGGTVIGDSWRIAEYLEGTYAGRPSLFGGEIGRGLSRFVQCWMEGVVNPQVIRMIVLDIHDHLLPVDKAYFRASRERRFGKAPEEVQSGREDRLEGLRESLGPLRRTLGEQPFLGGESPAYADYVAFGSFQWVRAVSPLRPLETHDPLAQWFGRCLDLYDGLGRRSPGYD